MNDWLAVSGQFLLEVPHVALTKSMSLSLSIYAYLVLSASVLLSLAVLELSLNTTSPATSASHIPHPQSTDTRKYTILLKSQGTWASSILTSAKLRSQELGEWDLGPQSAIRMSKVVHILGILVLAG